MKIQVIKKNIFSPLAKVFIIISSFFVLQISYAQGFNPLVNGMFPNGLGSSCVDNAQLGCTSTIQDFGPVQFQFPIVCGPCKDNPNIPQSLNLQFNFKYIKTVCPDNTVLIKLLGHSVTAVDAQSAGYFWCLTKTWGADCANDHFKGFVNNAVNGVMNQIINTQANGNYSYLLAKSNSCVSDIFYEYAPTRCTSLIDDTTGGTSNVTGNHPAMAGSFQLDCEYVNGNCCVASVEVDGSGKVIDGSLNILNNSSTGCGDVDQTLVNNYRNAGHPCGANAQSALKRFEVGECRPLPCHFNTDGLEIDFLLRKSVANPLYKDYINISPVPVSDILSLKFDKEKVSHIEIIDNKGSVVRQIPLEQSKIDVSGLSNGVYSVRAVLLDKTISTRRFIKE